jgi:hypothetical protein
LTLCCSDASTCSSSSRSTSEGSRSQESLQAR